jgi:hypothetical protein
VEETGCQLKGELMSESEIRWLSVAERLAVLVLFLGFAFATRLWWRPIDSAPLLQFITLSFLLLTVALVTVWLFAIPLTNTNDIDLESVARDRIKATVAILAMITILSGVSLIVFGVTLSNSCGDRALNRAELDDALKQAMAPLIAQFDTCKQRLDRAVEDGESPPPVEVQADVSCREFEALLRGNEEVGGGVPGSTSVLDLIDKGFDIGGKLLARGTETKDGFLDEFLGEFSKRFGRRLDVGAGQAVNELGKLVYEKLTTKGTLTTNVWVVRFDAIGSVAAPELDRQLKQVSQQLRNRQLVLTVQSTSRVIPIR